MVKYDKKYWVLHLVGVTCVGKSTVGKLLADNYGFTFIDFDNEVKEDIAYFHTKYKNAHIHFAVKGRTAEDVAKELHNNIVNYSKI